MSGSLPFISVVVPAYNRPAGLRALLDALAEQSYPPYRFEVLICDDGSKPALAEVVQTKDLPFSVNFLRDVNQGPAAARNRGLRQARGTIVAFTDDDCHPHPDFLQAIVAAFNESGAIGFVGGQVLLHDPQDFRDRFRPGTVSARWGSLGYRGWVYDVIYWIGRDAPANDRLAVVRALRSIRPTR